MTSVVFTMIEDVGKVEFKSDTITLEMLDVRLFRNSDVVVVATSISIRDDVTLFSLEVFSVGKGDLLLSLELISANVVLLFLLVMSIVGVVVLFFLESTSIELEVTFFNVSVSVVIVVLTIASVKYVTLVLTVEMASVDAALIFDGMVVSLNVPLVLDTREEEKVSKTAGVVLLFVDTICFVDSMTEAISLTSVNEIFVSVAFTLLSVFGNMSGAMFLTLTKNSLRPFTNTIGRGIYIGFSVVVVVIFFGASFTKFIEFSNAAINDASAFVAEAATWLRSLHMSSSQQ